MKSQTRFGGFSFLRAAMSDTTIVWNRDFGRGDWSLSGAMLQAGNDLETAILISLFTDREASPDDVIPDGTNDPRGWIGDADQDYKIGSRLWLLDRAKQDRATLQRANDYINEALQWLIDDGVVARFEVLTEWTKSTLLGAKVVAYKNNGPVPMNFSWVWKAIN
ncbi:phage GP46 family protein [soil metagenome]